MTDPAARGKFDDPRYVEFVQHMDSLMARALLCGSPIAWVSRKMSTVATSVFNAELQATLDACEEVTFIRNLLSEIGVHSGAPTTIFVDNQAVIDFSIREGLSEKSRLLPHKYLKIRELTADGHIRLQYVASLENVADSLSKPLNRPRFTLLCGRMNLQSL